MLLALIFSMLLVIATVLIHYETLRLASSWLPRLKIPPRQRIIVVIFATFCAHTVEIWLYAMAYFILADDFGIGAIGGTHSESFYDYLYFSTATYTSLGFGDVVPYGSLRIMAAIESLVGLLMIAWSASFTYVAMEKFWGMHVTRRAPPE
jgi:hypothetical protein